MQKETERRRKRRWIPNDTSTLFALIAVILSGWMFYRVVINDNDEPEVRITLGDQVEPREAQAILDRANDAASFADTILSLIEVTSAIVGVVIAVGAWMLRRSILDQVEAAQEFAERTEERLQEREAHLASLEERINQRLEEIVTQNNAMAEENQRSFDHVREQAQDSFRVLSLQLLAEQQVRAHNIETAIQTLQDARELEADNATTNYLLGYLYTARKQFDLARERLEEALQADPEFNPAKAALGLALRRQGDGISDSERVAERNLYWAEAETRLLDALGKNDSLTDADGESYFGTLGGLYRRQGRFDDAVMAYEHARQITPNSSYPIINLAALYTHQGDLEQGRFYFEKVVDNAALQLDADPRDSWTRVDLSQAKLVLGDTDRALRELRTVIEQNPGRTLLETAQSGLRFLSQSPLELEGLDRMLDEITAALTALEQSPVQ